MKRIYIAGKIGGLPTEEFTRNFEKGRMECIGLGYFPISPTDLPHDHDRSWESYMKEDMTAMIACDAVYALNNWQDSPGAKIEVRTAVDLKIPVIFQP